MPFKAQPFFCYEPLDKSVDSIRFCKLMRGRTGEPIQCHLYHDELGSSPQQYAALSYRWGEASTQRSILLNSVPFHIWPNLWDALVALRKPDEDAVLWIDAICINQHDLLEKGHQVAQMGCIYKRATAVLIWLGPAADNSDLAFDFLNGILNFQDQDDQSSHSIIDSFRHIVARPYWFRAWIRQEILLATTIFIHCGSKSTSWDLFTCEYIILDEGPVGGIILDRNNLLSGQPITLKTLLWKHGMALCQDPRDRVFALLSLASDCNDQLKNMADYTLDLPTLFLGLGCSGEDRNTVGFLHHLQRLFRVNFHNFFQPGSRFNEWRAQNRTGVDSVFRKAAVKYVEWAARFYRFPLFASAAEHGSGLKSGICCLETGWGTAHSGGAEGLNSKILFPIKGTDIGIIFEARNKFHTMKGILRAPWISQASEEAIGQNPPSLELDTQGMQSDNDISMADYVNTATAFLDQFRFNSTMWKIAARYDRNPEHFLNPDTETLAAILAEVSRRHKICFLGCSYLIEVVYSRVIGQKIVMQNIG